MDRDIMDEWDAVMEFRKGKWRDMNSEAAAILVLAEKVGELVEILESWKGRG